MSDAGGGDSSSGINLTFDDNGNGSDVGRALLGHIPPTNIDDFTGDDLPFGPQDPRALGLQRNLAQWDLDAPGETKITKAVPNRFCGVGSLRKPSATAFIYSRGYESEPGPLSGCSRGLKAVLNRFKEL